jgi:hypothetical protein
MRKFASLALVAALGLGAATLSKPADAGVVVGVGVGLPGAAVVAPAAVAYPPYGVGYYPGAYGRYPHYYRPGYWHGYGWGYGYHRWGYRGHWR